jgi:cell wall-associated NlpC family hydrolase
MAAAIGLSAPPLASAEAAKKASGGTAAASAATTPEGAATTEGTTTTPPGEGASPSTVGGTTTTSATTPATSTGPHAPVTARRPKLSYKGPVFEKTPAGQVVTYAPASAAGAGSSPTGGSAASAAAEVLGSGKPDLLVPGSTARYVDGLAAAPMSAPEAVQQIIWAGNQIVGLPYIWGGGHASFVSPGYDCSGTVSFALHGAQLISTPMDSSEFMHWGEGGDGRWVTVFTNPEHAYMTVAGLRLDTSPVDDPSNRQGPRWRPLRPGNPGFLVRHPVGL